MLGVGAGAGAGLTAVLLLTAAPGLGLLLTGSALGALAVLAVMLGIAARGNFGPERLLLAGVAMTALCSAVITAVIAMGNAQSYAVLRWLTGSTNQATTAQAVAGLAALLLLSYAAVSRQPLAGHISARRGNIEKPGRPCRPGSASR